MKNLFTLICLLISTYSFSQCDRTADSLELVKFYNELDGPNWSDKWDLTSNMSTWEGITLNDDGCVLFIVLQTKNLTGEFPIINLSYLETFAIYKNPKVTGDFLNISGFPSLKTLVLNELGISGEIPNFVHNNLSNIQIFKCVNLEGQLPSLDGVPECTLFSINNIPNIIGEIPSYNHQKLTILSIQATGVTGNIPNFDMPELTSLRFGDDFCNWGNPGLTGEVPNFDFLPNLRIFRISGSPLIVGVIPDFSNCPKLNQITLCGIGFSGQIPTFNSTSLTSINIIGNENIIGNIPSFSSLNLVRLRISQQGIVGSIPDLSSHTNMNYLSLNCSLTGTIPDFSANIKLETVTFYKNNFSGALPTFEFHPYLKTLYCRENNLSGNIPDFKNNQLLEDLNLRSNGFVGSIPSFNLENLKIINLSKNNLTSVDPIINLPSVEQINYSSNKIVGTLDFFDNLEQLQSIDLQNNLFFGPIPNFTQASLKTLGLSNNELTGAIPNFNQLPLLNNVLLSGNKFDSIEPTLSNINSINLEYNILTFEDLENIEFNSINSVRYSNMDSIPLNFDLELLMNEIVIKLNVDNDVQGSTYTWYKNNELYSTTDVNLLKIDDLQQGSIWYVEWVNPLFPALTLTSKKFSLVDYKVNLTGTLFTNTNGSCDYLNESSPIANSLIKLSNDENEYYTRTNSFGEYHLTCQLGVYKISYLDLITNWSKCQDSLVLNSNNDQIENLGVQPMSNCIELTTSLSLKRDFLRRCFNNEMGVTYCNRGSSPSLNSYVQFRLDSYIIIDSFNVSGVIDEGNGLFRYDIGTLNVGECGSLLAYVTTDCEAELGSTECIEAKIFPNDICSSLGSVWNGATLDVTGDCNSNQIAFVIKNIGETDMENLVQYKIIENDFIYQSDFIKLESGEELELFIPANGSTFRLEVDQVDGHPCSILPSVSVEGCTSTSSGIVSTGYVNQYPLDDACPFVDMECYDIIGSYDPNDMLAYPEGYGDKHYIYSDTEINYRIRFQNVGNDTAFNVYVIDTLPTELDLSSLGSFRSSHDMEVERVGQTLLFTFPQILLVDSIANEAESHGWISFKISPSELTPLESTIYNFASIIFDFNDPIITNTVFHTIGENFIPTNTVDDNQESVTLYPNPTTGLLTISLSTDIFSSFEIYDISGRLVQRGNSTNVDLINQSEGIYLIKIRTVKGEVLVKRIVKL